MQHAAKSGRETRENIKLGICGEHGGDPESVEFCHRIGLNYVSCSPFRIPIARLAAARAAVKDDWQEKKTKKPRKTKTIKRKSKLKKIKNQIRKKIKRIKKEIIF